MNPIVTVCLVWLTIDVLCRTQLQAQSLAEPDVPTGLLERKGDKIVDAPAEDLALAKTYHAFEDKGPLKGGQRITILTAKTQYKAGEPVRVLHVLEAVEPGIDVYLMGPKNVTSEFIDNRFVANTGPKQDGYRGMVVHRPIADFNYEITTYSFSEPGEHTIQWKQFGSGFESNVIKIEVVKE